MARASVSEVLPLPLLYPPTVPGTWLAGFFDLGGTTVPVIDLGRLLGLAEAPDRGGDPYRHLLLSPDRGIALLVERARDLKLIPPRSERSRQPGPSLGGCVTGEIVVEEHRFEILDLDRILGAEERHRLDLLARAAARRLADLALLEEGPAGGRA